jgi:hypothetical protein
MEKLTKMFLTLCLAGAALSPTVGAAGPGLAYGHDDSNYTDDTADAPPSARPLAAAAPAAAPATPPMAAGGTGAGAPQAAPAVRLVCHEVAADATEQTP